MQKDYQNIKDTMRYINQEYITNTLEEKIMMTLNNDLAFINAVLCFSI